VRGFCDLTSFTSLKIVLSDSIVPLATSLAHQIKSDFVSSSIIKFFGKFFEEFSGEVEVVVEVFFAALIDSKNASLKRAFLLELTKRKSFSLTPQHISQLVKAEVDIVLKCADLSEEVFDLVALSFHPVFKTPDSALIAFLTSILHFEGPLHRSLFIRVVKDSKSTSEDIVRLTAEFAACHHTGTFPSLETENLVYIIIV